MNSEAFVKEIISQTQSDAVVLIPGANLLKMTGLNIMPSERPTLFFLCADSSHFAICPQMEAEYIGNTSVVPFRLFTWTDNAGYESAFAEAAKTHARHVKKLTVEGMLMRAEELRCLSAFFPDSKVITTSPGLRRIRIIKSAAEIQTMRRVMKITEETLADALTQLTAAMTEGMLADIIRKGLYQRGCSSIAFGPLVQAGKNSANPHYSDGNAPITPDNVLLIDMGGVLNGFYSDITRTFYTGRPERRFSEIYDIVRRANEAGIRVAKPGVRACDVDKAVRTVIEDAGYGQYFFHRTGHGLGMEIHEYPDIRHDDETILEEGMVFTIEPGIYLPGAFGVRIEDVISVTPGGNEMISSFEKSPALPF